MEEHTPDDERYNLGQYDDSGLDRPPTIMDSAIKWDADQVRLLMQQRDIDGLVKMFLSRIRSWVANVMLAQGRTLPSRKPARDGRLMDDPIILLVAEAAGTAAIELGRLLESCQSVDHLSNALEVLCKDSAHRSLCEDSVVGLPQGVLKRNAERRRLRREMREATTIDEYIEKARKLADLRRGLRATDLQRQVDINDSKVRSSVNSRIGGPIRPGRPDCGPRGGYWPAVERLTAAVVDAATAYYGAPIVLPIVTAILDGQSLPAACAAVAARMDLNRRTIRSRFDEFAASVRADDFDLLRRLDPEDTSAFRWFAKNDRGPNVGRSQNDPGIGMGRKAA